MKRTIVTFLVASTIPALSATLLRAETLPTGSAPPALKLAHFPDRLHAFVWRNWEIVPQERMAKVLQTSPENVSAIGRSMGLPPQVEPPAEYLQRGYISVIRRNWHLLPYEQLLTLLGWDAEKLAFVLREDDFLWIKLGSLKPACPTLRYAEPNEAVQRRCAEIADTVAEHFGAALATPAKPRFAFFDEPAQAIPMPVEPTANATDPIRFLYSYCGVFGDPLLYPELDPYPDALLRRLSEQGINGVWLHVVLRQLARSSVFPEFGERCKTRIANLRKMAQRAQRYGIKIYLYMNEPRAMPEPFFEGRENLRGVREGDHFALCTSAPQVRQWITDSLRYVFEQVPELGGVFTITASENLTNCYSHRRDASDCPRCAKRSGPEVIAQVNQAIAAGVWAGNPRAKVICWDWGWPDGTASGWGRPNWTEQIIAKLPEGVYLMCVSEWGKAIDRGGVAGAVGEYSISTVGPGPRATKHWALARQRGLKTLAKVQVNCSWELSAVPFLPVMNLVAQHGHNLTEAGVDGLMLSWTVGGYPSPNLELVKAFQKQPRPSVEQALAQLARRRYGPTAAVDVLAAWSKFSQAFREYPFDGTYLYRGPTQCGPANLLFAESTGYRSTMVGFPYDDLTGWRGIYPIEVLAGQFEKVASGWQAGLVAFENAVSQIDDPDRRAVARRDLGVAQAAGLHFDSVANQIRFITAREAIQSGTLDPPGREAQATIIKAILAKEIQDAKGLFALTREDPRIGFEASNHYYYLPLDLVEKVVNCEYLAHDWPGPPTAP